MSATTLSNAPPRQMRNAISLPSSVTSAKTVTSVSPVFSSSPTIMPANAFTRISSTTLSFSDSVFARLSIGEARHLRQWWGNEATRILSGQNGRVSNAPRNPGAR